MSRLHVILLVVLLLMGASARLATAQIEAIAVAGDGEFTRITISSQTELAAETLLIQNAEQREIQLVSSALSLAADPYFSEPTGGVLAYRIEDTLIAFELDRPLMLVRELVLPPSGSEQRHRLILDLSQVSPARFASAAKRDEKRLAKIMSAARETPVPQPLPVVAATSPNPPSAKPIGLGGAIRSIVDLNRYVVVIDPGHGGRDPGALAVTGAQEKDIVLQTALDLKAALERDARYQVHLTRTSDTYVEHEDRVTMARNWGANLFISLHADAAATPLISGASVYTISARGERRIAGTADKYGWHIPIEDGASAEVSGILEDLVKRETKSNSAIFAELLVPELAQAGPLLRNTKREGNLFVLLAPDVPAVLVELGFLTNAADTARLKSEAGRRKSATAIKTAIDAYFDRQEFMLAAN